MIGFVLFLFPFVTISSLLQQVYSCENLVQCLSTANGLMEQQLTISRSLEWRATLHNFLLFGMWVVITIGMALQLWFMYVSNRAFRIHADNTVTVLVDTIRQRFPRGRDTAMIEMDDPTPIHNQQHRSGTTTPPPGHVYQPVIKSDRNQVTANDSESLTHKRANKRGPFVTTTSGDDAITASGYHTASFSSSLPSTSTSSVLDGFSREDYHERKRVEKLYLDGVKRSYAIMKLMSTSGDVTLRNKADQLILQCITRECEDVIQMANELLNGGRTRFEEGIGDAIES